MTNADSARVPEERNDDVEELDQDNQELVDDELESEGLMPLPDAEPSDGPAPAA
jgi:hypothetical protein